MGVYMAIWKNSKMFSICSNGTHIFDYTLEVIIDEDRIAISYLDEGKPMTYKGSNNHSDHFRLQCNENGGHGSLHRFPDEEKLEGSWVEGGVEGFWIIELKK